MSLKRIEKKEVSKLSPKEILKQRRSVMEKIDSDLKEKGVNQFSPDKELHISSDYLQLPLEITEVTSRDLGEHLNAYTQQKMYIRTLIGWTECMIEDARRDYSEVSVPFYKKANQTKMSEKAKDIEVNSEPEVINKYNELHDLRIRKSVLEMNLASIEDAIFMISREVSRRTGDFDSERRDYNVQRR